jgi:hypothetical protein
MGLRQELADVGPHWITRESAARHRSEKRRDGASDDAAVPETGSHTEKEGCAARRAIPLI